jgi:hypothetical protein
VEPFSFVNIKDPIASLMPAYSPSRLDPPKPMGAMGKIKRGISVSAYVLSYKYFGTVLSEYNYFFFRLIRNKVVYKAFWGKWGSII